MVQCWSVARERRLIESTRFCRCIRALLLLFEQQNSFYTRDDGMQFYSHTFHYYY